MNGCVPTAAAAWLAQRLVTHEKVGRRAVSPLSTSSCEQQDRQAGTPQNATCAPRQANEAAAQGH